MNQYQQKKKTLASASFNSPTSTPIPLKDGPGTVLTLKNGMKLNVKKQAPIFPKQANTKFV